MENTTFNAAVGKRIRETRCERGYTREKTAELSNISVQFLADIEVGRKSMKISVLRDIADALCVSTDYLINGTTPYPYNEKINDTILALPPKKRKQAEKLLTVFVDSIRDDE